MEETTDAQSTAPITDTPADEQLTDDTPVQDDSLEQVVDQVESAPVVDAPEAPAPQTRSERREQNYIDKLSEMIASSNQAAYRRQPEPTAPQYEPLKLDEGEYDLDQIQADRTKYGEAQRQQGIHEAQRAMEPLKQQLWAQQLEFDNERVHKMWDILDPQDQDHFDPDFAEEMTKKYLNFIGYRSNPETGDISLDRPNVRWTDFVRAEKQNIDRYVQRAQVTSTKNIVKQAAQTGIRPGGQPRVAKGRNVDTSDPNWISKLTREEYEEWGRELSDRVINERLGIR
jgi:hypothetical protein